MPARSSKRFDARSIELTKNLVNTSHQLENHFKSLTRREVNFKQQKLLNFEEELKATSRMSKGLELDQPRTRRSPSSPRNGDADQVSRTGPLQRSKSLPGKQSATWSGNGSGADNASAVGMSRCWSSPEMLAPQFPAAWGGHGVCPKPPGNPATGRALACTRMCADTPAPLHPPPHPGALSMRPACTRSLEAYKTSYVAAVMSPSQNAMAMYDKSRDLPPSPTAPLSKRLSQKYNQQEDEDITINPTATLGGGYGDRDPMIKRLGHFMALLGPRYKCVNKEMIWDKAKTGERTPAQRRLHELGGIENAGGGPDKFLGAALDNPVISKDEDGKARAAWLAARATERERRTRAARVTAKN